MELKGKNVALTGASSGIGLEILRLLLAEGCRVAACARHIENIKIQNENLFTFRCDTSKKEELDAFFGFAEEKQGQKTHFSVKSIPLCQRREPRTSVHV